MSLMPPCFRVEDGGCTFHWNVGTCLPNCISSWPRRTVFMFVFIRTSDVTQYYFLSGSKRWRCSSPTLQIQNSKTFSTNQAHNRLFSTAKLLAFWLVQAIQTLVDICWKYGICFSSAFYTSVPVTDYWLLVSLIYSAHIPTSLALMILSDFHIGIRV